MVLIFFNLYKQIYDREKLKNRRFLYAHMVEFCRPGHKYGCDQTCICLPGWTGKACDCALGSELCINLFGISTRYNFVLAMYMYMAIYWNKLIIKTKHS